MMESSIQHEKQTRTVFDVVRPFSEIQYDIDIARGVPTEQAKKNKCFMQQLDMTTEKFLQMCEVSGC